MTLAVQSDRPARSAQAIAFCCDAGYAPFAAFAAAQIAALAPDRQFDILICGDPAPDLPESLSGLGLRRVSVATRGAFAGLRLDGRRTESAYLRLALPDALGAEYDRILYLDSDIHVASGDFGALLDVHLGGHAIGAVRDNIQWRTPDRRPEQFRRFGWRPAPYLNSGLLLIDTLAYREAGLMEQAIEMGRREKDRLIGHDQTLINCLLRGAWAELSPVWNWQYSRRAQLTETMVSAHVVHFIGHRKPWSDAEGWLPPRFARALAPFLATHFPGHVAAPSAGRARDAHAMRTMYWRHWVAAPAMARYLSRFPSELSVDASRAPPRR